MRRRVKVEQLLPEVVTALVSIAVSYGVIKTKVANMEQKIERFDADHDLLVEIKTKLDLLLNEPNKRSKK